MSVVTIIARVAMLVVASSILLVLFHFVMCLSIALYERSLHNDRLDDYELDDFEFDV